MSEPANMPAGMPAAYLPLQPGDLVKLAGWDAVVIDQNTVGVTVQILVEPRELTWTARYR